MAKYIDKAPPQVTGDPAKDMAAVVDYLGYLRELLNYILTVASGGKN